MGRHTSVASVLAAVLFLAAVPAPAKDTLYVSPGNLQYGVLGPVGARVLDKKCYVIAYCDSWRIPFWSAYYLGKDSLKGNQKRQEKYFQPDTTIPKQWRAIKADYKNSGYDRGHLAPAADFKRRLGTYVATYLLSNMSPQRDSANRRVCAGIEDFVRGVVKENGEAWIVVGNTFLLPCLAPWTATGQDSWIGRPRKDVRQKLVAVPSHMFRTVLTCDDAGHWDAYAWLVPNTSLLPTGWTIAKYQLTVDSLEKLTGWDFFPQLDSVTQAKIEADRPQ